LPVTEAVEEPEVQTEAEPVTDERPRGPDGKFIAKEPTGVETPLAEVAAEPVPPTEPTNQLPPHEYAALKDERRKRQEAEARAAAIEAHYANLARQQQAAPQQPQVDFWDNPQEYLQGQFSQFGQQLFQQFEQRQQAARIDQSEAAARARHQDYDQAFQAFSEAVQANPRLAAEMAQAPDPAEYAYSKGKTALALEQAGSIEAIIAAERQKWEAEAKAAFQPVKPTLPSTTAADGSVAGRGMPQWAGPSDLGDILR
jgi:hypothetical protein